MQQALSSKQSSSGEIPAARYDLFVAIIMGLMGAFFWAIRGTSGYGGSSGGALAGMGWAVLWYGFANLDGQGHGRLYASPRMLAAITFGIAFGGLSGYGVYIAWLQGRFYLEYPEGVRAIAPWTGYAMLFVCGLHWGGITGAFMAWCAPRRRVTLTGWVFRLAAGIAGAALAGYAVRLVPDCFLPFYEEGLYAVTENGTCIRALHSVQTIALHSGLFLGFLAFELWRRDWRAVGMMLVLALGFAIPFTVGGYWHTLNESGLQIDWWKNWEMSIGLGGGLAFGLAFRLFNRPLPGITSTAVSSKEMLFGGGLPLWLVSVVIVAGACNGFSNIHGLKGTVWNGVPLCLVLLLPAGLGFAWWIYRELRKNGNAIIPASLLVTTLILIILAGYLVSTPLPLQPAHKVLLMAYTFYISMSLLLFLFARKSV